MEDDEDCYGFGALSDLFDARAAAGPANAASNGAVAASLRAVEPKRLDVAALSRFWWSERRLGEFRRGAQRHTKEYHHVAAKFDGMRVDGGLGSAFLVPTSRSQSADRVEEGGVLWVQAQASDSNAQARRKKEFQDITNRQDDALKTPKGSTKSTATVFLKLSDILDAKETRVQNTVQGITFTLRSGQQFEITFMPGPFYDSRNRDEMLEAFNRQQVDDVFSPESSPQPVVAIRPPPSGSRSSSQSSSPDTQLSQLQARVPTPRNSPAGSSSSASLMPNAGRESPTSLRQANRELIRCFVRAEKGSSEAISIAQKIHSSTDYHVGPLASEIPDFSADLVYRKQMCVALDAKMKKLNHNWAMSEQARELHTRARCGKGRDDTFEYTDTVTQQPVSSRQYRNRYMEFVEAKHPESHPVIRMFEPRSRPAVFDEAPPVQQHIGECGGSSPTHSTTAGSGPQGPCELFGIDFRYSSVVDAQLMSNWRAMPLPTDNDLLQWRDLLDVSALSEARASLVARVAAVVNNISARSSTSSASGAVSTETHNHPSHRRPASRRRSLDQANIQDIRAQFGVSARSENSDASSPSNTKRRRSDGDASQTSGRRRRRQSLVGTLDTALFEEQKIDGLSPSSNDASQPIDSTCPLCCDADAVVVMKPCGHSVCRACWGRLTRAQDTNTDECVDTRQCPWDRESVVER